jgi:Fe-S cluster biogenesis protein NfuA/nitrite reductase/ring-hydroxylating ferredoxin subunit
MGKAPDVKAVGARIEQLLDEVGSATDARIGQAAEELVRTLMEFYGAGLARVVELADDSQLRRLADDELVSGLLVLHELHPLDTTQRVQAALDKVRPYLGSHSGDVEMLGVDDEGVVHLRLAGSCDGCPSSLVTVKMAIESAIQTAAPEVTGIDVAGVVPEPVGPGDRPLLPLQAVQTPEPEVDWIELDELIALPPGTTAVTAVGGAPALVCNVDGDLYAYRDRCAACAASLRGAALNGQLVVCPSCDGSFDVRQAGRAPDNGLHLDPLPLLVDRGHVRIAVSM